MPFTLLHTRYQSAGIVPPPYAHFYELTARPGATGGVQVDFSITYIDRETLDEEDITGEGFTLTDNFSWSGTLGGAWLTVLETLVVATALDPFNEARLGDADAFLEVTIEQNETKTSGTPTHTDAFLYPVQELIQATYEAGGKEKPFELRYCHYRQQQDLELLVQAVFADRHLTLTVVENRREDRRTLPWAMLKPLMGRVFAHDYDPAESLAKPPRRDGHFLNIGAAEWYDIHALPDVQQAMTELMAPVK